LRPSELLWPELLRPTLLRATLLRPELLWPELLRAEPEELTFERLPFETGALALDRVAGRELAPEFALPDDWRVAFPSENCLYLLLWAGTTGVREGAVADTPPL